MNAPTLKASRRRPLILAFIGLALALMVVLPKDPLTEQARAYSLEVTATAGATYGVLRLLNRVLSTAQEIEISATPLGVGANVRPLVILEPADDAIERTANVVFAILIVAGLMSFFLPVVAKVSLGVLALVLIVQALLLVLPPQATRGVRVALQPLLREGLHLGILGLVVVSGFILADLVSRPMKASAMGSFQQVLANINADIGEDGVSLENYSESVLDTLPDPSIEVETDASPARDAPEDGQPQESNFFSSLWNNSTQATGDLVSGATASVSAALTAVRSATAEMQNQIWGGVNTTRKIAAAIVFNLGDLITALVQVVAAIIFRSLILPLILILIFWRIYKSYHRGHRLDGLRDDPQKVLPAP